MKKYMFAGIAAVALASAAPTYAQSVEADPFASDQSLVLLAGLGTAGTVAAVVAAVVVVSVVVEAVSEDSTDSTPASTSGSD